MMADGIWWDCENGCRYDYNYTDDRGYHHKFEAELGDWFCALNLYPEQNKTVVTAFHKDYLAVDHIDSNTGHTEISISYCMTSVTPQNVKEKLKLILMFS